jgi:hypothetical protein
MQVEAEDPLTEDNQPAPAEQVVVELETQVDKMLFLEQSIPEVEGVVQILRHLQFYTKQAQAAQA